MEIAEMIDQAEMWDIEADLLIDELRNLSDDAAQLLGEYWQDILNQPDHHRSVCLGLAITQDKEIPQNLKNLTKSQIESLMIKIEAKANSNW